MKLRSNKNIIIIVIGVIVIMGILGLGASHMLKEINEEKSVSIEEINEIQVNTDTVPVHYIETDKSSDAKMHLHGKVMADIKIITEISNKALIVKLQRTSKIPLYEDFVLDIYIPKKYANNLSINTSSSSGCISTDSLDVLNFTLNTHSGIMKADTLLAEKISINSVSGNINVNKIDANELVLKGKSSAINIDECIAKQSEIETSTGSITLNNSSGTLGVKTGSGKVLVAYNEFEDQEVNIKSSTGNVTLELPSSAEFLIEAKTSTGKIQSDFHINENGSTDKKKLEGKVGTKNNKVILQTSSGSIKILKKQ